MTSRVAYASLSYFDFPVGKLAHSLDFKGY